MEIREREEEGIVIITLDGRIDAEGAIALDDRLHKKTTAEQYKLVLDMTGVPYINSMALRILAEIITVSRDHGGDLRLVGLQPKVRRVLQIVGFDRYSTIYNTIEEALAGF